MRKVITSYINPDLDGISLMYAYAEFLKKKGEDAEYYCEGTPRKEVGIVLDMFGIELNSIADIEADDKIILVDTNSFPEISEKVTKDNVVEIIDHHQRQDWLDGRNIKVQIDLIGAAATIVAERFKKENISISRESAILLYYGIISNTMNLKIKLTNQRDIEMAKWLRSLVPELTDEITKEIFVKKSDIGDRLREEMEIELKDSFMSISWSMGQLEVANLPEFLAKYESKIRAIMDTVSKENDVEYVAVNCMDIINGYSIILARDERTAKIITEAINNINFDGLSAKTTTLVSRKELVKVLREVYKKEN